MHWEIMQGYCLPDTGGEIDGGLLCKYFGHRYDRGRIVMTDGEIGSVIVFCGRCDNEDFTPVSKIGRGSMNGPPPPPPWSSDPGVKWSDCRGR